VLPVTCEFPNQADGDGCVVENGLITQSRLILLDSPLVAFTAFTALAWTSFLNVHEQGASKAFGPNWWLWLAMTGLGLGATVSVKWVGLFTIAWVGSLTVLQLWFLLGDVKSVTPVGPSFGIVHFRVCLLTTILAFVVQTFFCSCFLSYHHTTRVLYVHVCYSLPVSSKPRRW